MMDSVKLLPLILFAILPVLLVRAKILAIAPDASPFWPMTYHGDANSWWKAVMVCGLALWMAAHATIRFAGGWRPRFPFFALLLLCAALSTLASVCLSAYPRTAWLGYTTLYEGALVLLGYLAAIWYAAEMTDTDRERLLVTRVVGMTGLVNAIHGILEGCGWNFWRTRFGSWLMGVDEGRLTFTFADTNMAYGTQFQPNHYGMFMAMMCMLALGMLWREKSRIWRCLWALTFVCGLAAVVFSNSRTAIGVCAVVTAGAAVVCLYRRPGRHDGRQIDTAALRRTAGVVTATAACIVAVFACLGKLDTLGEAAGVLAGRIGKTFSPREKEALESVELSANTIVIHLADRSLALEKRTASRWNARRLDTGDRDEFFLREKGGHWSGAEIPGAAGTALHARADGNLVLTAPGIRLRFFQLGNELFAVDHKGLLHDTLPDSPKVNLGRLERLLGGRGYTWSRALAVVPQHLLFGSGPGTFAMAFPQYDLVGKQRYLENLDEDKGHGVWITFLVQLGIAGFVLYCLPIAYVSYTVTQRFHGLAPSLAMGMAAFMLGSITNDSTIGVTAAFCLLAGLALSQTGETVQAG